MISLLGLIRSIFRSNYFMINCCYEWMTFVNSGNTSQCNKHFLWRQFLDLQNKGHFKGQTYLKFQNREGSKLVQQVLTDPYYWERVQLLLKSCFSCNNYRVPQPRTTCGVWGAWCGKCLMAGPWRPWVSWARLGQYPKVWPRPTWSWWPRTPPSDPTPLPRSDHMR